MANYKTMARLDEILADYNAQMVALNELDFADEIEREVALFREKLLNEKKAVRDTQLREVEISILAVKKVREYLLTAEAEEEIENATTEQSDFTVQ